MQLLNVRKFFLLSFSYSNETYINCRQQKQDEWHCIRFIRFFYSFFVRRAQFSIVCLLRRVSTPINVCCWTMWLQRCKFNTPLVWSEAVLLCLVLFCDTLTPNTHKKRNQTEWGSAAAAEKKEWIGKNKQVNTTSVKMYRIVAPWKELEIEWPTEAMDMERSHPKIYNKYHFVSAFFLFHICLQNENLH